LGWHNRSHIDDLLSEHYSLLCAADIKPWWVWGYWISPLSYAQNAIAVNEFTAPRWRKPNPQNPSETLGFAILRQRGLHTAKWWIWWVI
jgi:hypothetical protein